DPLESRSAGAGRPPPPAAAALRTALGLGRLPAQARRHADDAAGGAQLARRAAEKAPVTFFARPDEFRAWLRKNHEAGGELVVGFWKRGTGRPGMTWPESVDEALCFGWIDGKRRSLGDDSYCIRFTPRRRGSIWSAINIAKVAVLTKAGRMAKAGFDAFAAREEKKSAIYAYEKRPQ